MSDCIFCNIINGEAAAAVVYEDDNTLAFMDIGTEAILHDIKHRYLNP